MNEIYLRRKLKEFLREDLEGVEINFDRNPGYTEAKIVAEESGVFCGGRIIAKALNLLIPREEGMMTVRMFHLKKDGEGFKAGDTLAHFTAPGEALRNGIRTVLNLIGHMTKVATNVNKVAEYLGSSPCELLDTRKTTPGLRIFEKYAVKVGGGKNHRFGRFAGELVKKEDIKILGGIKAAIDDAEYRKPHLTEIEVEVENLEQLEEVLRDGRARYIMLDNMSIEMLKAAVWRAGSLSVLEASGIGDKDLREVAGTGVHYISLSSLILGASPIKMHMIIVEK
mgnify:CR=1 FL=1